MRSWFSFVQISACRLLDDRNAKISTSHQQRRFHHAPVNREISPDLVGHFEQRVISENEFNFITSQRKCAHMMTSSNRNIFRVTGHLCGEFTGPRWIPRTRPVTRSFDVFFDLRLNKLLSTQSWGWWIPGTKGHLRGKCFHLMTSSWVRYKNDSMKYFRKMKAFF